MTRIKKTTPFFVLLFFFLVFFFAKTDFASAVTYYVSISGSNTNNGLSEDRAWRTINQAAQNARAGDIVKIKGGTYNERVIIRNSGAAGSPIVFEAYGGTPLLKGNGSGNGITINGKSYITINGLRIENFYSGINARFDSASDHLFITNNRLINRGDGIIGHWNNSEFSYNYIGGIYEYHALVQLDSGQNDRGNNNIYHHNTIDNPSFDADPDYGIWVGGNNHHIYSNYINLGSSRNYGDRDHAGWHGINLGKYNKVTNTIVECNTLIADDWHSAALIEVRNTENVTVRYNTITKGKGGLQLGTEDGNRIGNRNVQIYNNIITRQTENGVTIHSNRPFENVIVRDNIFDSPSSISGSASGITFTNNKFISQGAVADPSLFPCDDITPGVTPTPTPIPTPTPTPPPPPPCKGEGEKCANNGECCTEYCYEEICKNLPELFNPEIDTTSPSIPTGLKAFGSVTAPKITISWLPSIDDMRVEGYNIFRNGIKIGTSPSNSYQDYNIVFGTTYTYTVSAYDEAGNESAQSEPVSATSAPLNVEFEKTTSASDFTEIIENFLFWILSIAGSLALLLIIAGGVIYMTSVGDEQKIMNAKKTVFWAIIGLVIILFAYSVALVLNNILL